MRFLFPAPIELDLGHKTLDYLISYVLLKWKALIFEVL